MIEKNYIIYTISICGSNDIRYVGVTTKTIKERFSQHKYNALNAKKRCTPLSKWMYKSINSNQKLLIEELDNCTESTWQSCERYWIYQLRTWGFRLLNVDEGGVGVICKNRRSISGIQRSSDAHKKRVIQMSLSGEYIKTYESVKEAAAEMGLNSRSAINNVITKRSKSCAGFFWLSEDQFNSNSINIRKRITAADKRGIKVYQFDLKGTLINSFNAIKEASRAISGGLKIDHSSSIRTSIRKKSVYKSSFWSYENKIDSAEYNIQKPIIKEVDKFNNVLNQFFNFKEAMMYFGYTNTCSISNLIREKRETKNGTFLIRIKI